MDNGKDETTPDPEKKKELKVFTFTRFIGDSENIPQEKDAQKQEKDTNISFTFILALCKNQISFSSKKSSDNPNMPNIIYKTVLSLETLRSLSKFFNLSNIERIFELIQKSFELNHDKISIEGDVLRIKLYISLMDILTEEINIELQKIKLSNEEEVEVLKENMKSLDEEKNNLKNEIKLLNNTLEGLRKKMEEKEKESQQKEKDLQTKIELKENSLQNMIKKLQQDMKEVKEIENYVKEQFILEEKEEKELKMHSFDRKLTIKSDKFDLGISLFLFEDKIKIKIKEIQNDLESNPLLYEHSFIFEDFGGLSGYYMNKGGIESIFEFLIKHFTNNKDKIEKEENKIIINVKFLFAEEEESLSMEIDKKKVGLEKTLENMDKSFKEIKKENIKIKEEFKKLEEKKLRLEQIYPIGSIYLSINETNPSELFGIGEWELLKDRFLIGAGNKYYAGDKGGNTSHTLTINEMPSHTHVQNPHNHYTNIFWKSFYPGNNSQNGYVIMTNDSSDKAGPGNYLGEMSKTTATNQSTGGNQSFDITNPYLSVYMWKRIK